MTTKIDLIEGPRARSVIGGFYAVYNYYGFGLMESVYCGALEYELIDRGHRVAREVLTAVEYKGRHVAWQRIDMLVDDRIILEIKASERLPTHAERQIISYLHATPIEVGLLLHFGPEAKFYRFINTVKKPVGTLGTTQSANGANPPNSANEPSRS
jgi:GxxExxY protein